MNDNPLCGRCGDPLEVVLGTERLERARSGKNLCEVCVRELEDERKPKR